MTFKAYVEYAQAVSDWFKREGVDRLSPALEACDQHEEFDEDCEDCLSLQGRSYISKKPCDVCDDSYYGDREDYVGFQHRASGPSPVVDVSICIDCVYYNEHGRLDDQQMAEVEADTTEYLATVTDQAADEVAWVVGPCEDRTVTVVSAGGARRRVGVEHVEFAEWSVRTVDREWRLFPTAQTLEKYLTPRQARLFELAVWRRHPDLFIHVVGGTWPSGYEHAAQDYEDRADGIGAALFDGTEFVAAASSARIARTRQREDDLGEVHTGQDVGDLLWQSELFASFLRPAAVADDRWATESARSLARAIYDDRAWGLYPILADALEDGGFAHAETLTQLRASLPPAGAAHRGYWLLDALIGYPQPPVQEGARDVD